ncbi:PREDICTED: protein zwilch homolog [Polistes dominula]|uniref:Protein zwilch n=1 Tax=Polistes dominula TaxID=743375 RepID=A0ABM1JET8_POLDO|nr:PREDICTED: protein zwilch homolog [Polistes dominula]
MDIVETIKNILCKNSLVTVKKRNLSFIDRLFPEYKNYLVIFKKSTKHSEADSSCYDLEVTGDPLEYSFNDECINSTLITERYWGQDEEEYIPLTRIEACTLLNLCHENLHIDNVIPIFILCDGKDYNKTLILGSIVEKNWLNTIEVTSNNIKELDFVKNVSSKLLSEHLELSFSEKKDVSVFTLSTYNLFGWRYEMQELSEIEKLNFEGSITLNIIANNMLFDPPIRSSKNSLILEIITGRNNSALANLWHQLSLINQYLTILDNFKEINAKSYNNLNSLKYPDNFVNPYAKDQDQIMDDLNLLLTNNYSYRQPNYNIMEQICIETDENNMKLKQCIEAAFFRLNLEFTDFMWELLICTSTYTQMTECMHKILKEIQVGECQPQLNITNNTKLAKILPELSHQKTVTHLLMDSIPLEILIDIGFEKVNKDYKYILMNTGIVAFNSIYKNFEKKPEQFDSNFYRKKLINMIQVHICLEFMLLLQEHINCETDVLQSSLEYIIKEMTTKEFSMNTLEDLCNNKVYTLTIPAQDILINEINKGIPATWKVDLFSESELLKTKTITYFSDFPIFPPNLYSTDQINKINEAFHMVTALISSTRSANM